METYDTIEQAVHAALTEAQTAASAKHRTMEKGGILFQNAEGKYFYSPPANERPRGGAFQARVQVPQGSKPVAVFHNHPDGRDSDVFSPDDVHMAQQLNIPSYIIGARGRVHVFNPAEHEPVRSGNTRTPRGSFRGVEANLLPNPMPSAAPEVGPNPLANALEPVYNSGVNTPRR